MTLTWLLLAGQQRAHQRRSDETSTARYDVARHSFSIVPFSIRLDLIGPFCSDGHDRQGRPWQHTVQVPPDPYGLVEDLQHHLVNALSV